MQFIVSMLILLCEVVTGLGINVSNSAGPGDSDTITVGGEHMCVEYVDQPPMMQGGDFVPIKFKKVEMSNCGKGDVELNQGDTITWGKNQFFRYLENQNNMHGEGFDWIWRNAGGGEQSMFEFWFGGDIAEDHAIAIQRN